MPTSDCRVIVYRDVECDGFRGEIEGLPGIAVRARTIEELRDEAIEAIRSHAGEWMRQAGGAPFVVMNIPAAHMAGGPAESASS